jgi:hypothetical protein
MAADVIPDDVIDQIGEEARMFGLGDWWAEGPNPFYRCLDCANFELMDGGWPDAEGESKRFRAENHSRETGHRVGFFLDDKCPFDDPLEVIA